MKQGFLLLSIKKLCGVSLGQKKEKGKKEREGEKARVRERRRKEFSVYVIGNALACYSSPIHIPPSSSRIIP